MRIVILAPNIYSERPLVTILGLREAGYAPVGCLSVSTTNMYNLARKMTQEGPKRFLKYAMKRTGLAPGAAATTGFENPYLERRLQSSGKVFKNIAELCRADDIPLAMCRDINEAKALAFLQECRPDLIVYTGGGILRKPLLQIPRIGVLNTHAGVLPQYRGMNVAEWSIMNGDDVGITVHLIDSGIDTGKILFVKPIAIPKTVSSIEMVRHFITDQAVDAMIEGVQFLASTNPQGMPQKASEGKQYFVMHQKLLEIAEQRLIKTQKDVVEQV